MRRTIVSVVTGASGLSRRCARSGFKTNSRKSWTGPPLFKFAKATPDPTVSAALLEKADCLKLRVDEDGGAAGPQSSSTGHRAATQRDLTHPAIECCYVIVAATNRHEFGGRWLYLISISAS